MASIIALAVQTMAVPLPSVHRRYSLPPKSSTKLCVHCKRPHNTGKAFCSAECCRAERAGEPRPEPGATDIGDRTIVIITESPDASPGPS